MLSFSPKINNDATDDLEVPERDNTAKYVFKFDCFRQSLRRGARAITHHPHPPLQVLVKENTKTSESNLEASP